GTAISNAMADVSNVPTIGTRAPYVFWTGSQLSVHRKLKPYSAMDSRLPYIRDTMMAPSKANTKNANPRVIFLNIGSINVLGVFFMSAFSMSEYQSEQCYGSHRSSHINCRFLTQERRCYLHSTVLSGGRAVKQPFSTFITSRLR